MNSKVLIAAGLSLVVVGGIVAALVFLSPDNGPPVLPGSTASTEKPAVDGPGPGPGDPGTGSGFTGPVARGAVEVTVLVEDANGRALSGRNTKVRVWKTSEADRTGQELRVPEVRAGQTKFSVEPGSYDILAQSPGYTGQRQSKTIIKDQEPLKLVFRLERGHSIAGRVVDRGNRPVANARVYAFQELVDPNAGLEEALRGLIKLDEIQDTVHSETTTDANGEFRLDGLESFWYSVRATATNYTPRQVPEVRAPRENLVITLDEGSRFEGLVVDTSGRRVAGAKIHAYEEIRNAGLMEIILSKSRPSLATVETDDQGAFAMTSLGAGEYNFLIEKEGYQEYTEMRVQVRSGTNNPKTFTLNEGRVIRGVVVDPENNGIAGARVRANPLGAHVTPRDQVRIQMNDSALTTNEYGQFEFNTLADGRYMLLVWHDDYESAQRKDVEPSADEIQVQLEYGGRIEGQVRDASTSAPIAGATVSCTDLANLRKEGITDENGHYIVSGLGSARRPINVYVRAEGYARDRRPVTVRKGQVQEESFDLQPAGVVEGSVVSSTGQPLAGARVEVRPDENDEAALRVLGSTVTDRQGLFYISNVEPGRNLVLRVKMDAYLETKHGPVDVEPGQEVKVGPIAIQLGGEIKGEVVDAGGNPVIGAWVEARAEGETELTSTLDQHQSDRSGFFHLKGLQSGLYNLIVKATGFVEISVDRVEVREGQINTGVRVVLEQGGVVAGVILDGSGQLVQGAEVVVRDFAEGLAERRAVSDAQGRFSFTNIVSKDSVELEVRHDDYSTYTAPQVAVGSENLEILLTSLGGFLGSVLDPDGSVVPAFSVQPQPQDESPSRVAQRLRAKTFNGGQFEYRGVPAGTYSVYIRSLGHSAVTIADVRVGEGEMIDLGAIQLQEGGLITGSVVEAGTGTPVAGANVRVTQGPRAFQPGKAVSGVTTGPDGRFSITGLKDQVLTLEVTHENYAPGRDSGVDPRIAAKSQGLKIELVAAGEIYGTVVNSRRQPQKGVSVYLIAQGKASSRGGNQPGQTDENGNFRFGRVAPGSYIVKAHRFGNPPASYEEKVDIESAGVVEVILQLD